MDDLDFREPTLDEEFAGRMNAADRAARAEDAASQDGPYAFLSEHSRVEQDGTLTTTCRTDGEPWPCTVARAFFAGRRSGFMIAAGRLDALAEGFTRTLGVDRVQQVADYLRHDGEEIDEQIAEYNRG